MKMFYNHQYINWHKMRNIFLSIILTQLSVSIISCKKFVEVGPPNTQLVSSSVFQNSYTATSAMTNIYQQMYNNIEAFNLAQQTGWLSDELTNYSSTSYYQQYYTNSMDATSTTFGPWNNAYNYVYQANAIIEGLENNSAISPVIERQLIGEAKFMRAFWNFYLTNCYGDIPLATSTSYTANASLARTPQTQVFQQVITDLKDAQNNMSSNFVDASDTTITSERVRPNKWAAAAFLSRMYLYTKKYDSAEATANSIINNTDLFNLVGLDSVFLTNNTEAIWQLGIPLPNIYNTYEGYYFILQGPPGDATGQPQALSTQLIHAFDSGDNRKTRWISYVTTTAPNDTFYYPYKYKVYNNATPITEYTTVLRLAEQFLIRAEARVQLGDNNGAKADLNMIRHRAGLSDYAGGTDQASLLNAILHERQVELFTEWGHRWFDLIRTGNINTVMDSPENVCQSKGGTWSTDWQLFPIPQTERSSNPRLSQNPGY